MIDSRKRVRLRPARECHGADAWDVAVNAVSNSLRTTYTKAIVKRALLADGFEVDFTEYSRVAMLDGRVVGFVMFEPHRAHITALYVDPECQGLGIGRRLLNWAFRRICQEHSKAYVWAELPALGFYTRNGYRVSSVATKKVKGRGALPMAKLEKSR